MTRVVVHIGAQRTGSEPIHRGLFANVAVLAEHGVLVPETGRHEMSPNAVRHHLLAWSIDPARQSADDSQLWEALAREIDGSPASTALLSSELFAPLAADPVLGQTLLERLRGLSDDITVVFLVREQLGLLNSLYCNRVKALEVIDDFDTYLEQSGDIGVYDLAGFLRWHEAPVRFVAVPWDEDGEGDPFLALLAAADIAVDSDEIEKPAETLTKDLGPIGIEATRLLGAHLHERFPDFQSSELAARRLRRQASTEARVLGWCDEEFWGWSPRSAEPLLARYAAGNQAFADASWGGDWPLPSPLDRPANDAKLIELDRGTRRRVQQFVKSMERRFTRLRARQDAT